MHLCIHRTGSVCYQEIWKRGFCLGVQGWKGWNQTYYQLAASNRLLGDLLEVIVILLGLLFAVLAMLFLHGTWVSINIFQFSLSNLLNSFEQSFDLFHTSAFMRNTCSKFSYTSIFCVQENLENANVGPDEAKLSPDHVSTQVIECYRTCSYSPFNVVYFLACLPSKEATNIPTLKHPVNHLVVEFNWPHTFLA